MEKIKLQNKIDLKNYTTIKVGGISEYFYEPNHVSEFIDLINWAKSNSYDCRIIGAGSNLLIKSIYLRGLTICTKKMKNIKIEPSTGYVYAECGVMLPILSNLLAKNSCKGGEWTVGIPGTVGGALFMNAGCGNSSISENLSSVQVMNIENQDIYEIKKEDLDFNYRFSSFQENNLIILSAKFYFKPSNDFKSIIDKTKSNLKERLASQPYHLPSFGSVFKNPCNNYAGKLIEETGLKGFKLGGAEISEMHANFIVNNSSATSDDILQLIYLVQQKVIQKKGILLDPEVRMIGFEYP
ncbi:MAG: UDP-N-acetylenolpyruvoylglucosamine reductase [Prochlorococcus sp. SP3034]|nr:UDP-N-acetylenolpyruvoylglucosamine reductase [Prochlorococcus sp. SP3034]|tara:strand:+ start:9833 stop:10723 length:891 start_codon:yes stop_codon:yes gene_type:complete